MEKKKQRWKVFHRIADLRTADWIIISQCFLLTLSVMFFLSDLLSYDIFRQIYIILYDQFGTSSCLTSVKSFVKQFIGFLRILVHDSNGTLEPLFFMLGLTGFSGFVCTAVDELVTKRTFGITMRNVMNHFFPHYHLIEVINLLVFYILGGLMCKLGYGKSGFLCVLGLLISFVHALWMYESLHVSTDKRNQKVISYLQMERSKGNSKSFDRDPQHQRHDLYGVIEYVNSYWRASNTDNGLCSDGMLEQELVRSLDFFLQLDNKLPEDSGYLINYYIDLLAGKAEGIEQKSLYVLTQMPFLDLMEDQNSNIRIIRKAIVECREFWDHLLLGDGSNCWKERLVVRIFDVALQEKTGLYPVLALGFIFHLRLSQKDPIDFDEYRRYLSQKSCFLHQLSLIERDPVKCTSAPEQSYRIQSGLRDIRAISMAVIAWTMEVVAWPVGECKFSDDMCAEFSWISGSTQRENSDLSLHMVKKRDIDADAAIGFFLLWTEDPDFVSFPYGCFQKILSKVYKHLKS